MAGSAQVVPESSCLRCKRVLQDFSPYCLRDEKYVTINESSTLLITSIPSASHIKISFAFELPFIKSPIMGAMSEFIFSCLLHSMSHECQITPFQQKLQEIGAEVICSVDSFMLFFQYTLPSSATPQQMHLCYNDMQERLYKPSLVKNQNFKFLTPYLKKKMMNQTKIWHQFIFQRLIGEKHSSNNRFSIPDITNSKYLDQMANLDLWNEAYNLSLELCKSRLFSVFQSHLELTQAEEFYLRIFKNFLDKQQPEEDFIDPVYMYDVESPENFVINSDLMSNNVIFFSFFIPINRFSCETIDRRIFTHLFEMPELKEQFAKISCFMEDFEDDSLINILGVLHRILTIKIKSFSSGSSIETIQQTAYTAIMKFLKSFRDSTQALDTYTINIHQIISDSKYIPHYIDLYKSSTNFLACRVKDHQIQDHLNILYCYENKTDFQKKIIAFINFILEHNCLSCFFAPSDNWHKFILDPNFPIYFEPYSSSKCQRLRTNLCQNSVPFEFLHNDISDPILGPYNNPKLNMPIRKNSVNGELIISAKSFKIFELRDNYSSLNQYFGINIHPNPNLFIDNRWDFLFFEIVKNSLMLLNVSHRIFEASSNQTIHFSSDSQGVNIMIQGNITYHPAILIQILCLIDATMNFINSNSTFFLSVLNYTLDHYQSQFPDNLYTNDILVSMINGYPIDNPTTIRFIDFLKTSNIQKQLLINITAFFTTSSLHVLFAHPFNVSFLHEKSVSNLILKMCNDFDESRAFKTNCSLLDSHRFDGKFSKFFSTDYSIHCILDSRLTTEKVLKHFLIARNPGVNTIVFVNRKAILYKVGLMYHVRLGDSAKHLDGKSLNANFSFVEYYLRFSLDQYTRSLTDIPQELIIINCDVEVFFFDDYFFSIQVNFDCENFIIGAEYIMKKIGLFFTNFTCTSNDILNFKTYVQNSLNKFDSLTQHIDVCSSLCHHLPYFDVPLNQQVAVYWVTKNHSNIRTLHASLLSTDLDLNENSVKSLLQNIHLKTIIQQQGLMPPSRLVYLEENYEKLDPKVHIPGKDEFSPSQNVQKANFGPGSQNYDSLLYMRDELKFLEEQGPLNITIRSTQIQNMNGKTNKKQNMHFNIEKCIMTNIKST